MEEIQRLKLELENEVSTPDTILSALKVLGKKNLSKEVLMSTKVGHTVNRLRRQGSTEEIRQQAKVVFRWWRQFVTDLEKEKPLIEVRCDKKTEALRGKGRQLIADALQMTVWLKLFVYLVYYCEIYLQSHLININKPLWLKKTREALDWETNSPRQCLRKYIKNNMKNMDIDVSVYRGSRH